MPFEVLLEAIYTVTSRPTIWFIIAGILIGIFVGATPGLGSTVGMAILLPLTVPFGGIEALLLLVSVYAGSMWGASIASILINVPGTASAAATTLDGYPMTKQGKATTALSLSLSSSIIGGLFSAILIIILSPVLIDIVRWFGTPEYFLLTAVGLAMIALVSEGTLLKGLTIGIFGFALATIGMAPSSPTLRYTFDSLALFDGISYVAVLLGIFAGGEMIRLAAKKGGIAESSGNYTSGSIVSGFKTTISKPILVAKSSLIGLGIGAIPGTGAALSNFVAYIEAQRSSKTPELFGTGHPDGVIASESSNSATVGGSVVPTIAFGIPGSGATAVLLGGLIMHGVDPGVQMFTSDLHITYALFVGLIIGSVIIAVAGLLLLSRAYYITKVDTNILIPMVIVLACLGAFALRNNWLDVWTFLALGYFGYFMMKHDYSLVAFLLGVILGPIAESTFLRSLNLSEGSFMIFVSSVPSAILVVILLFILSEPIIKNIRAQYN